MINPGVSANKAQAVLHDDCSRTGAQYGAAFLEDQLHQAGILLNLHSQLKGARRGIDLCQVDQAIFRFGDNLLRQNEYIPILKRQPGALQTMQQNGGKVIARLDQGNARKRGEVERHKSAL